MPGPTLKVPTEIRNLLQWLHPHRKRKVWAALADILEDPDCWKALKDELEGYWSLPIARTRIIYRSVEGGVEIVAIGPRQTIYEDAFRQIAQDREKPYRLTTADFVRLCAWARIEMTSKRKKVHPTSRPYEEGLDKRLKSPEYAIAYLNAILDENGSRSFAFRPSERCAGLWLHAIAESTGLNRESLYTALAKGKNPRIGTHGNSIGDGMPNQTGASEKNEA
jgi:DNA-binding phage protein/mRNA-degrading endonuclease RelE of RelBE toxin-antitoxin system